jgi:hypothetical protein
VEAGVGVVTVVGVGNPISCRGRITPVHVYAGVAIGIAVFVFIKPTRGNVGDEFIVVVEVAGVAYIVCRTEALSSGSTQVSIAISISVVIPNRSWVGTAVAVITVGTVGNIGGGWIAGIGAYIRISVAVSIIIQVVILLSDIGNRTISIV